MADGKGDPAAADVHGFAGAGLGRSAVFEELVPHLAAHRETDFRTPLVAVNRFQLLDSGEVFCEHALRKAGRAPTYHNPGNQAHTRNDPS